MAGIPLTSSSKLRLFRGIVHAKAGDFLRESGTVSYTRIRELFLAKLTQLEFKARQFGLHSLRAGGATAAANAGVLIGYLSVMAVGGRKLLKMDT